MYLAHAFRRSPHRLLRSGVVVLVVLAATGLIWIGRASADEGAPSSPGAVARSFSNVPTAKADAVDATIDRCTSSIAYADMPDMSESFTLGGTGSRPVLVLFHAALQSQDAGGIVGIQLLIDGIVQPGGSVSKRLEDTDTGGFNFISATLTPGTHTAKMQWRSANQRSICILNRSMIVLHK